MHARRLSSGGHVGPCALWLLLAAGGALAATPEGGEKRDHWAFRPVREVALPSVSHPAWVQTPMDRFVLARLDAAGLAPAPPADKRTLIRRATYDLIGLPPTAPDIRAFLADASSHAFDRVVDRLLASPHYGERWGRHWLDVARYADSNGLDENVAHGNAWRYRDYVVDSFNRDTPYDVFLVEQLAGDLLPTAEDATVRQSRLIATGFLALGPKVLAEPDKKKMEMDIIDEQIDTVGRSLMGLTLGCARCHDHKFDPIGMADYYGLAGIFKSTRTMESFKTIARWHEHPLASEAQRARKAEHDRDVAARKDSIKRHVARAKRQLRDRARKRTADYLLAAAELRETDEAGSSLADLARERKLIPAFLAQWRQYLTKTRNDRDSLLQPWHAAMGGDGVSKTVAPVAALFAGVESGTRNVLAHHYQVLFERAARTIDDDSAADAHAPDLAPVHAVLKDPRGPFAVPKNAESLFPAETRTDVKQMREALARLETSAPILPSSMGVTEGEVADVPIHLRGSHLTLGDTVPRRFPRVLVGPESPVLSDERSGRLQLARWLAHVRHPLTARVMVNRLWRWHFGRGLVGTPNNFGRLGERPVDPALLDWLAGRFVEGGWSIKAMHRLILRSSAYQMASTHNVAAARIDPENRLGWRMHVRRLEAEPIRDAVLAVSRTLDATMGGSMLHVKNREFLFNHTSQDNTKYESRRRSLYLPVVRNHLYDMFSLFDYVDASVPDGDRATTTVAPQALFMMNSDFINRATEHMAAGLLAGDATDDSARIERLYVSAYGRSPSPSETTRARSFLARFDRTLRSTVPDSDARGLRAWQILCQVIVAANEFIHIR